MIWLLGLACGHITIQNYTSTVCIDTAIPIDDKVRYVNFSTATAPTMEKVLLFKKSNAIFAVPFPDL